MRRLRRYRSDLLALVILILLPLMWFAPVLFPALTHLTLLPFDNLYSFEPWRSLRPDLVPHNNLLSDLVLENAVWKLHIRHTLAAGQLPLWNPQIFTGLPFLAAGQASTFYPLSILFYILPLTVAYGWFTALQIGLAGANMYILGRVLRLRPLAALLSGVVYMFSGFMIVSVVFTMFIAAAAWLPLVLAVIELIIRKQEEKGNASYTPIPYVAVGALAIGCLVLAGHPELMYYTLLVAGLFASVRLLVAWRTVHLQIAGNSAVGNDVSGAGRALWRKFLALAVWLLVMVAVGLALGGVQLLPLLELLPHNFRAGSASFQQVIGWAWPSRHILTFLVPDIFGNPSHHRWFDLWSRHWAPATTNALGQPNDTIFWGIKNYVEGGNYLGIATWLLAAIALLRSILYGRRAKPAHDDRPYAAAPSPEPEGPRIWVIWFFAGLALASLLFAFGTPLYAILFYGLPGWNQLHSPFRWVFPFTVSMAVLGGTGLQTLLDLGVWEQMGWQISLGRTRTGLRRLIAVLGLLAILAGVALVGLVAVSLVAAAPFIALGQKIVDGSDLAQMAFAGGRMFWSYEALNLLKCGLFILLSGLLVWLLTRRQLNQAGNKRRDFVALTLVALVALDLYAAHGRFNPATDTALSPLNPSSQPPVVEFINRREQGNAVNGYRLWRFTTFNAPGEKTLNANVGMYYGWQDIRGYDSIIPRQYVQLMDHIAPQENELLYNRIAPLYSNASGETYAILDNPLLDLLNVKYIVTQHVIPNPKWQEIYRDRSVGVYENRTVMPRVFIRARGPCGAGGPTAAVADGSAPRGLYRTTTGRSPRADPGQPRPGRRPHQPLHGQRCLCRCQSE